MKNRAAWRILRQPAHQDPRTTFHGALGRYRLEFAGVLKAIDLDSARPDFLADAHHVGTLRRAQQFVSAGASMPRPHPEKGCIRRQTGIDWASSSLLGLGEQIHGDPVQGPFWPVADHQVFRGAGDHVDALPGQRTGVLRWRRRYSRADDLVTRGTLFGAWQAPPTACRPTMVKHPINPGQDRAAAHTSSLISPRGGGHHHDHFAARSPLWAGTRIHDHEDDRMPLAPGTYKPPDSNGVIC